MTKPLTALEFFTRCAYRGRAILDGTADQPEVWLARVDRRLYVCHHLLDGIRTVPDDATVVTAGRHRFTFGVRVTPSTH